MLSSLPLIAPRDTHTLWHHPSHLGESPSAESAQSSRHHHQHSRSKSHVTGNSSALHQLELEEQQLLQRKSNIRRFGATWLRPPGVSKTFQAMVDEAAERAEQEALARREAALAEQQAAAEAAEEADRRRRDLTAFDETEDSAMAVDEDFGERDLDDEVPEAENDSYDDDDDDNDNDNDGNVSISDGSANGADDDDDDDDFSVLEQQERDHDLDDDIPEAGSYQHTDTDLEDDSSVDDSMAMVHGATVIQDFNQPPAPQLSSLPSSPQAESSMLVSSPSAPRARNRPPANPSAFARSTQRPPRMNLGLGQPDFQRP